MKKYSFNYRKNKSKLIWIPVVLIIAIIYSCTPSKKDIEFEKTKPKLKHKIILTDESAWRTHDVTQYFIDSCEYFGKLRRTSSDFITHSGQCKRCEKRHIHLLDSIIKANLTEVKKH